MFRSEAEFVAWLSALAGRRSPHVQLGIGDDAALVRVGAKRELALATDLSVEGVHFTPKIHPPRSVGHRALARALSDMAAMGATPRFALVSLAISKRTERRWVEEFYAGVNALARRFGVSIIGGDTAVVPGRVALDVVAAGDVRRGQAVRRSGARPGDLIFVSGQLGMSGLGLRFLQAPFRGSAGRGRAANSRVARQAIQAHLFPQPRCPLGQYLAEHRLVTAMIDISDGLSSDLGRIAEASEVGAHVRADSIPAPGSGSRKQALNLALHGGEDYELLFTVPPQRANRIPGQFQGVRIRQIGEISGGRGLTLIGSDGKQITLQPGGYDHFRNA